MQSLFSVVKLALNICVSISHNQQLWLSHFQLLHKVGIMFDSCGKLSLNKLLLIYELIIGVWLRTPAKQLILYT